jgi:hypothetical protein
VTPTELFNDRTFFTLFTDAYKARKDSELGPIRLEVMIEYLKRVGLMAETSPALKVVKKSDGTFDVKAENEPKKITKEEIAEIDRLNALNATDPLKARKEACDVVEAAIKDANVEKKWTPQGTIVVQMKRSRPVQNLLEDLKTRGVHVSGLVPGLPMQGGLSSSITDGSENSMWAIVVTK